MQLRLGPQREVLHRWEALRDELGREDGLTKATVRQPWRPGRRRPFYNVHLIALVEESGRPSSSAIGLVEKILRGPLASVSTATGADFDAYGARLASPMDKDDRILWWATISPRTSDCGTRGRQYR
jgi:hypothetical protein